MNRTVVYFVSVIVAAQLVSAQTPRQQQKSIPGVLADDSPIELVRGGFQRLEGPVATTDGGLFFSDVDQNRTYKHSADGTISVWRENTNNANGLLLLNDGRLLAAECGCYDNANPQAGGGRIVVVIPNGQVTAIATQFNRKPLRGPNDLIADGKGGIYFSDPGPRYLPNIAPTERRNVYYIRPNGDVLLLDDQMMYPNGITLSLDEKTLFVGDTFSEYVYAFDVLSDGRVKNKRQFVKLREPEQWPPWGLRSRADGMAIDSKGRLYVATASGVQVIDPRGEYIGTIRTPSIIRNLAFAGPHRQTLYMTALESLYRVQMLSEGPASRAK
jgi:gluconolactonase